MQSIKFSHEYFKMPSGIKSRKTYLLGVTVIHYSQLPSGFIFYDTLFSKDNKTMEHYPLPKTQLIILTLFTDSELSPKVWTTLRRFTQQKYDYYNNLIGKEIKIIIEEK